MFGTENAKKRFPFCLALSTASFFTAYFALLLISSIVLSCTNDPLGAVRPTSVAVLFFSALLGGAVSSRLSDSFPAALLSGSVSASLFFLLSLFFENSKSNSVFLQISGLFAIVILHALAWLLLKLCKDKRRRTRKRRRQR